MTKRMLIDDTCAEETRVVIVNGNKVEDVEFESTTRKQIKGNIYLAKVMRVEPSLQAAFVDYGGNKHGFLAFGEIHPDYYNLSKEELAEIDKEVDDIIEAKRQALKERELERERYRAEKAAREEERRAREAEEKARLEAEALQAEQEKQSKETTEANSAEVETALNSAEEKTSGEEAQMTQEQPAAEATAEGSVEAEVAEEPINDRKHPRKKRILKKRARKALEASHKEENAPQAVEKAQAASTEEKAEVSASEDTPSENKEKLVVMSAEVENHDEVVSGEVEAPATQSTTSQHLAEEDVAEEGDDDDDDDVETDFEIQRKLLRIRKMFHRSKIQDVIKEGQTLLVQVVKEERGNKGAALTTYLSLAGRYCVLMPNRIKSGGVSRKITNVADRKRLKGIVKELPLNDEMSMIVRTAGEEKTKADIVRDYNYLIRSWNQIRLDALKAKAPALIHEEGNLIRRALRDMYTKDISEIIVDGEQAYKAAKEFVKILSPNNLKKIKENKKGDLPLFQKFQVESQLDKLHDTNVQLESGGYLVINPTEALVSIDVNSGRATKEKDLEETALKTNLEAADEIAKQLRMRNLAGLVVVDFIDMEDPKNNQAVEKRMKEAMKKDRARIQIAKMSCFGLLEISRQRMHSSFFESNYQVCPHCHGKGIVRTIESGAMYILRCIEEEGIKNKSSRINLYLPSEFAVYLLNQKRKNLSALEDKYNMEVIICADDSIKNIADYRIERVKAQAKPQSEEVKNEEAVITEADNTALAQSAKQDRKSKRGRRKKDEAPEKAEKVMPAELNEEAEQLNQDEETSTEVVREENSAPENAGNESHDNESHDRERRFNNRRRDRRNRFDRRGRNRGRRNRDNDNEHSASVEHKKEKSEAIILYNSHEDIAPQPQAEAKDENEPKEKSTWWRKLIKS